MLDNDFVAVVGKQKYSIATSILLADSMASDIGRPRHYLYKTAKGAYFKVESWPSGTNLKPLDQEAAIRMFEKAHFQRVTFSEAFPDVIVEEA